MPAQEYSQQASGERFQWLCLSVPFPVSLPPPPPPPPGEECFHGRGLESVSCDVSIPVQVYTSAGRMVVAKQAVVIHEPEHKRSSMSPPHVKCCLPGQCACVNLQ